MDKQNFDIDAGKLKPYLTCKDHIVSRETFELLLDEKTELLITSPQPEAGELMKYYESDDYISHTDSKKSVLDKVYQLVKNYTINKKIDLINSLEKSDKSILDIGCGTGDFIYACKNNNWKIRGIEPSSKARNLTIDKLNSDLSIVASIEDLLKNGKETYDVITMWHVLEHVLNLEKYIEQLKALLKPNGTLIIAVPNYKSYDATYYQKYWAAYDVPRHIWHFSQKAINEIFSKKEFLVIKTIPMKFDAFYVSLLSEKYKTGKSNLIQSFYRGFVSNLKANRSGEYSSLIYLIKNKN